MKRWAGVLLRIVVTGVFLAVVVRMIQFRDVWYIRAAADGPVQKRTDVLEARREGDEIVLRFEKGYPERHPASRVVRSEGFLSLLDHTDKGMFLLMSAAFLGPFTILGFRWWLLLKGHGFDAPFGRIFFVNYAGVFFNLFLPGGVGGDLTKMVLASEGESRKATVVATVLLDRLIGLAVLIFLGAACLAPYAGRFPDKRIVALVFGLAGAVVLGYLVYFNPFLRSVVAGRLPFRQTLGQLDGVFRTARERKPLVAAVAGLSLCSQVVSILIIFGLAWAMGIRSVPLWQFFVFEPIIFIVTALPISMGGWGVQEWVYEQLFGGFAGLEANQAIALSVLVKISQLVISVPGGILFALGASRRRPAQAVAAPEARL